MIPIKLSTELNPNLIYDEVYERYTLNRLNGTLKFNLIIPENGKYMLCVKYNSLSCPKLALFLDGKIIVETTDTVKVTSNTASSADVIVSVLEQT